MKKWMFCFAALIAVAVSCKKEAADAPSDEDLEIKPEDYNTIAIPSSKNKPGLGRSTLAPDGVALHLPSCVKIEKRPNLKFAPDVSRLHGSSQAFYVAVSFVNTCSQPAAVELPPGLILIAEYQTEQNGLLVERTEINVLPTTNGTGGVPDTTTIYLALNCLNKHRSPPEGGANNEYNISMNGYNGSVVGSDPNVMKLLELLNNKPKLKAREFIDNSVSRDPTPLDDMYAEIQAALWSITDGNGLTVADVKKLKAALKAYE
jgi:hypothetical protein